MSIHKVTDLSGVGVEAQDDAWHQIADDDQVADRDSEALDCNGCIEHYCRIRIGDLREGKERRRTTVDVLGATRLEIQTEAGCDTGPHDDKGSEEDAHLRHGSRHGKDSGTDNCHVVNVAMLARPDESSYLCSPSSPRC